MNESPYRAWLDRRKGKMSENPGGDTSESGFVRDLPKRWLFRPLHWLAVIVAAGILNTKVVVIGSGKDGLPIILGNQ